MVKSIETESRNGCCHRLGAGGNGELSFKGYRVSDVQDARGSGDGCR